MYEEEVKIGDPQTDFCNGLYDLRKRYQSFLTNIQIR